MPIVINGEDVPEELIVHEAARLAVLPGFQASPGAERTECGRRAIAMPVVGAGGLAGSFLLAANPSFHGSDHRVERRFERLRDLPQPNSSRVQDAAFDTA